MLLARNALPGTTEVPCHPKIHGKGCTGRLLLGTQAGRTPHSRHASQGSCTLRREPLRKAQASPGLRAPHSQGPARRGERQGSCTWRRAAPSRSPRRQSRPRARPRPCPQRLKHRGHLENIPLNERTPHWPMTDPREGLKCHHVNSTKPLKKETNTCMPQKQFLTTLRPSAKCTAIPEFFAQKFTEANSNSHSI